MAELSCWFCVLRFCVKETLCERVVVYFDFEDCRSLLHCLRKPALIRRKVEAKPLAEFRWNETTRHSRSISALCFFFLSFCLTDEHSL